MEYYSTKYKKFTTELHNNGDESQKYYIEFAKKSGTIELFHLYELFCFYEDQTK